jgi:hypothetical protein
MKPEQVLAWEKQVGLFPSESEGLSLRHYQMLVLAREDMREQCLNCYSPDDSANDWADKIRNLEV